MAVGGEGGDIVVVLVGGVVHGRWGERSGFETLEDKDNLGMIEFVLS